MPLPVQRRSQRAAADAAAVDRQKMVSRLTRPPPACAAFACPLAADSAVPCCDAQLGLDSPLLTGLHVPSSLHNHKAVATLLTHSAGHTPLADLRTAIASKRRQTAERSAAAAASLAAHPHTDTGHALDHSLDPNKAMEWPAAASDATRAALFGAQLAELRQHEALLDITPSLQRLGQAVMTEEERAELEEQREAEWEADRAEERRRDRERLQVEWGANTPAVYMADAQVSYVPTFQSEDGAISEQETALRKEQVCPNACATALPIESCNCACHLLIVALSVSFSACSLQLVASFVRGVSKLVVRQRVEARIEAATRQLSGASSLSHPASSFLSGPLSTEDEALLSQLTSWLQPLPLGHAAAERFDAGQLLGLRSGGVGAGAAVPALFEPVVLHEHSASSDELVRQLLTPPPAVVEPVAAVAVEAKGAKAKAAAAEEVKPSKPTKAP